VSACPIARTSNAVTTAAAAIAESANPTKTVRITSVRVSPIVPKMRAETMAAENRAELLTDVVCAVGTTPPAQGATVSPIVALCWTHAETAMGPDSPLDPVIVTETHWIAPACVGAKPPQTNAAPVEDPESHREPVIVRGIRTPVVGAAHPLQVAVTTPADRPLRSMHAAPVEDPESHREPVIVRGIRTPVVGAAHPVRVVVTTPAGRPLRSMHAAPAEDPESHRELVIVRGT
jgi:hypothetical protein